MKYPKSVLIAGTVILFVMSLTPIFHSHLIELKEIKAIQNSKSYTDQKKAIIRRIETRVPVPEPPKILTVNNKENMKNLSFSDLIQDGDKIIIFPKAKIGVIYNPQTDSVNAIVDISDPKFSTYEKMAH